MSQLVSMLCFGAAPMNIFYQGQKARNLTTFTTSQTIMQFDLRLLAFKASAPNPASSVIATDLHSSPLYLLTQTPKALSYGVYGYTASLDRLSIGFNNELYDAIGECYHLGNGRRPYSPSLMRFKCADSFSPFGVGGLNPYAYTGNDPVNRVDPTGRYHGRVTIINGNLKVFYKRSFFRGKKKELRIYSHGNRGSIQSGEKMLNAEQLFNTLKDNNIDATKLPSRIYSCYSATKAPGTGTSLIEDFAALTGKKSTGFDGMTVTGDTITPARGEKAHDTISFKLKDTKEYQKNQTENDYYSHTPITVLPPSSMSRFRKGD